MSTLNTYLTDIARIVIPVITLFILATCVISLFRNRPRLHKMAQLVDQQNGSIIDIDRWEISIGKSRSNDIVLNTPEISRFHAVISKKRSEWVITDTFSKQGVFVNGSLIDGTTVIEDGDLITIGNVPLKFVCADAVSNAEKAEMRNVVAPVNSSIAYAVLVDVQTHRPVYIKKQDVLIGRGDDTDIRINLDTVSAHHARIHLTTRGWALSDLNSHNGTKLNGRFINQPQLIFDEDIITFGERVFVFYER